MAFPTAYLISFLLFIIPLLFFYKKNFTRSQFYVDILQLLSLPFLWLSFLLVYTLLGLHFLDFVVRDMDLYLYYGVGNIYDNSYIFFKRCTDSIVGVSLYVGCYIYVPIRFLLNLFYLFVVMWWPWLSVFNDVFFIQFFLVCIFVYIYMYYNIYFTLVYIGLGFFLLGIYLSVFQLELFTAFLWLVECSVLFVFLLFLFFLNVKGAFNYVYVQSYQIFLFLFFLFFFLLVGVYFDSNNVIGFLVQPFNVVENYYEAFVNSVNNDLFVFFLSYYFLNVVEFLIVGFILLVGSVICVNLYQMNKNIRTQSYFSFLGVFNFLVDFSSFYFFRRQNIIKQGNTKTALKFFKKK